MSPLTTWQVLCCAVRRERIARDGRGRQPDRRRDLAGNVLRLSTMRAPAELLELAEGASLAALSAAGPCDVEIAFAKARRRRPNAMLRTSTPSA